MKLNTKEIQEIELDILLEVDKLCKEHQIEYFLIGGTLLGAIRHKGFIPWDDDIDIMMRRSEYNKFIKLIKSNNSLPKYLSFNIPKDNEYLLPYIKVTNEKTISFDVLENKFHKGLWIDIFPLDYIYNDKKKNIRLLKKMIKNRVWIFRLYATNMKYPFLKQFLINIIRKTASFCGITYEKFLNNILKETNKPKSNYVTDLVWCRDLTEIYPTSWFEELIDVEFEGHIFKGIKHYDEYLTQFYGDYMKLPPENQRITHGIDAYLKDDLNNE